MANLEIFGQLPPIGKPDAPIVLLDQCIIRSNPRSRIQRARQLKSFTENSALLVIDMQIGFDDPAWGPRNNPILEANVAALIAAWRVLALPVIHVHHDSPTPCGRMRPGTPGNAAKHQAKPLATEKVHRKRVNSAFIGTSLEADLAHLGVKAVFIAGLTTNHCISTTARMAGNLGFDTFVIADATATFDRAALDGTLRRAADVHAAALSDLQGEFAEIVETKTVLAATWPSSEARVKRRENRNV